MNCEDKDYSIRMQEWLYELEPLETSRVMGEVYYSILTNLFPLTGLSVYITTVGGKTAIVFQFADQFKVYYPTKVEIAFRDYKEGNGKYMFSSRVDDTFWIYEERFSGVPEISGGILANFGMDMTMPFLDQQNFKLLE